ncbi:hypothetical protein EPA93_06960 [Ktedonosporobacter rubrisoli]|uniref:Uncharacterized protein n=1 Tax=Ktedonosporobacter rubrisoli TaxID=2509675 RepID=A0A4P6JKN9_KTERU|nr:hypothetical protein [Ktedonosporobacter rubrisoli]QBD75757.1 hypothetical protein EPA93_06960 [Ktedonosporobacter rubrisoli]
MKRYGIIFVAAGLLIGGFIGSLIPFGHGSALGIGCIVGGLLCAFLVDWKWRKIIAPPDATLTREQMEATHNNSYEAEVQMQHTGSDWRSGIGGLR